MAQFEAGLSAYPAPTRVLNAILFNIGWLAIVVTHSSVLALLFVAVFLSIHFSLLGSFRREWQFLAAVSLFGIVVDQLLFGIGILTVAGQKGLAPLWITCLWPLMATTLLYAFQGLQSRPLWAILFGAVGGGLSYLAGARMTEVDFFSPVWGPVVIGIVWGVMFPALLHCAARVSAGSDAFGR